MLDHLRVRRGAKDGTLRLQLIAQRLVVDEVAVVRHRELPEPVPGEERLHVAQRGGGAGRGKPHVADGCPARGVPETRGVAEHVPDEPQPPLQLDSAIIPGRGDAGALLPAVLQLLQAEVAERRGVRVPDDAEHAALLAGVVVPIPIPLPVVVERRDALVGEGLHRRGAAGSSSQRQGGWLGGTPDLVVARCRRSGGAADEAGG
uniref:Uncharacterized protein n=1 Tax=Oryza brachyantha TaxID=4533 RepID=J3L6A5_ORYBR